MPSHYIFENKYNLYVIWRVVSERENSLDIIKGTDLGRRLRSVVTFDCFLNAAIWEKPFNEVMGF